METENKTTPQNQWLRYNSRKKIIGGVMLLIIGGVLLASKLGVEFPEWFFTWQMIVILVGIYSGLKSKFQDWSWLIQITIGVLFLGDRFIPDFSVGAYMWPIIVIAIGLTMLLKPKCVHNRRW